MKSRDAAIYSPVRRGETARLAHDPEKWESVFGKDHAPAKTWSGMMIRKVISR
jgi:hypothetical protein